MAKEKFRTTVFFLFCFLILLWFFFWSTPSAAHEVSSADIEALRGLNGIQLTHYVWLGCKHMLTGYDHLLFLLGVIFYIRHLRDVVVLVSLFALGHSLTLILGVVFSLGIDPFLVDAIIGLSVVYKGFDNLGGFRMLFSERPNEKLVVLVFGLFHGLGLATKLEAVAVRDDGLVANLLAFNVGVELGQLAALVVALGLLRLVPVLRDNVFIGHAVNVCILTAGFAFMTYQIQQYLALSG